MSQLTMYLFPVVLGLSGVLSYFFYAKTKKKGFVVIGTAFVIQVADLVIFNVFLANYFLVVNNEYVLRANLLSTFNFAFAMTFAILLSIGLILLFTEIKPKTSPQLLDAKK
ncbi:MAG TPA: hypothetical protein VF350_03635 [Candidatus Bathyarchaeia archaeon]